MDQRADLFSSLSNRELQCLKFLAHGMRTKEIGQILTLSPRTVEGYTNNIKEKTGILSHRSLIELYWEICEKKSLY